MALIEIDGLPFLKMGGTNPWQTVNVITRWYPSNMVISWYNGISCLSIWMFPVEFLKP
jgi:hypothetical protein